VAIGLFSIAIEIALNPSPGQRLPRLFGQWAGLVHAGGLALALGFVKDQRSGDGNVERLGHAVHRNDDLLVNQSQGLVAHAEFFSPHHHRAGLSVVRLAKVDRLVGKMRRVEPEAGLFQFGQPTGGVLMADQFHPALGAAGSMVELRNAAFGRNRVSAHDANGIAGAKYCRHVVRLVDPLHEHGQVRLATGGNLFNTGFAFRCHGGMVAAMTRIYLTVLLVLSLTANAALGQDDPDFAAFSELIEQTLASNGPGVNPGDRSELYRYTPDGWELQLFSAWSGQRWLLLALRLHHPDRIERGPGQWQDRYDRLLSAFSPAWLEEMELPELIDVPPPHYNPAVPEELRSRRFTYEGFWYEGRWFNSGGVDEDAAWSLISYDLVVLDPDSR